MQPVSVIGSRFLLQDLNSKVKLEQTVNVYPIGSCKGENLGQLSSVAN